MPNLLELRFPFRKDFWAGGQKEKTTYLSSYLSPLFIINHSLNKCRDLQPRAEPSTRKPEVFSGPAVLRFHADVPRPPQPAPIYGCHREASDPDEVRMLVAVLLCWPDSTAV